MRYVSAVAVAVLLTMPSAQSLPDIFDDAWLRMAFENPASVNEGSRSSSYSRISTIDRNDPESIRNAVVDIASMSRANASAIAASIESTTSLAGKVRAAYAGAWPDGGSPDGTRTQLDKARSATGLAEGTLALAQRLGRPYTLQDELAIRSEAATLPPNIAKAAAVLIYAILDAMTYTEVALSELDEASWTRIEADHNHTLVHRTMEVTPTQEGVTVTFPSTVGASISDQANVTASVRQRALVQGLEVLAEAAEEARALLASSPGSPPTRPSTPCLLSGAVVFATDQPGLACMIVIGDATGTKYRRMATNDLNPRDMNALVIDLGGDDTYIHRAGGGDGAVLPAEVATTVQVNFDYGSGRDTYHPASDPVGPTLGSGMRGIGLLFDQGGDDDYITGADSGFHRRRITQGAGEAGAGMLADLGGNDLYVAAQTRYYGEVHAQGVAMSNGTGILYDVDGEDSRFFNVSATLDAGGAQGFAHSGGTAYLLDYGYSNDLYEATQDLSQAAATLGGFAYVLDKGGQNTWRIKSSSGCADMRTPPPCSTAPMAGWSQAYADTLGMAILHPGTGTDLFKIDFADEAAPGENEGRAVQAAALPGGVAVLYDPMGPDTYQGRADALGYAFAGLAVFTDTGGVDLYRCEDFKNCYGYASDKGLGVYHDAGSAGDTFHDGRDHTQPRAVADLGIGVKIET